MLEGKLVNLKLVEREDIPLIAEWVSKPEVFGEYQQTIESMKRNEKRNLTQKEVNGRW
jgi:hypothetical protein